MEHPTVRGLSGWVPLARGGFTLVWEARQDLLSRPVAVKVYRRGIAEDVYETFAREASAAGRLSDHPGVVTVYDAGLLPDARPYLIMELCTGGSLTQWLDPANLRTEEQIRQVGMRVADALAGLHARGVLHRDVKPANILIDGFGRPRLADFGLAVVVGAEATATDALRITPAYAPPEAFRTPAATESGDVFSLAATLYALLSGHPPRRLEAAADLLPMAQVAAEPIPPLPGVNWFLMDALMTGLSADSDARPSAAEFRDRLAAVPGPRMRLAKPPHPVGRQAHRVLPERRVHAAVAASGGTRVAAGVPPRRLRRRRVGILAAAAALVMLATSTAAWLIAEPASSGAPTAALQDARPDPRTSAPSASPSPAASTPVPVLAARDTAGPDRVVETIQVKGSTTTADPFETVRVRGTYRGGAHRFVQVQWWANGGWQAFPVPAKTDGAGQFTAFVELSRPNDYRLRVRDPQTGIASEPFTLVIKDAAGA
ncbi:MAG TPA: serine/threonine-protein kinase [Microlunatus sp.]